MCACVHVSCVLVCMCACAHAGEGGRYQGVGGFEIEQLRDWRNHLKAHELGRLVQLVDHARRIGVTGHIVV